MEVAEALLKSIIYKRNAILPETHSVLGRLCVEIDKPALFKTKDGVFRRIEFSKDEDILFIKHKNKFYRSIDGELDFGSKFKGFTVGEHMGNGWYRMYAANGDVLEFSSNISMFGGFAVSKDLMESLA